MKTTAIKVAGLTFEHEQWESFPDRCTITYTEHPAHCGDSSIDTEVTVDAKDAERIVRFLMTAYPQIGRNL